MEIWEACKQSSGLLRRLLGSIRQGIILAEAQGRMVTANPFVEHILGYSPRELEGMSCSALFTPEDRSCLYPNLLAMACRDEVFEGEIMLVRRGGARFFAYLVVQPCEKSPDGEKGLIFAIQDIDRQKRIDEAIRGTHYDDLITMADGIAHELRNPLVGIGGFAQRLYQACRADRDHDTYYRFILNNLRKIETLVKKVEFLARLPSPVLAEVSLGPLVEQALAAFSEPIRQRRIDAQVQVEEAVLLADPEQIHQVVTILLKNALEALSEGGFLGVRGRRMDGGYVLEVFDTGATIPAKDLPFVFNPFFSTKPNSAGMDLAIAKRVMERHGGRITARSRKGEGTTFSLWFPFERRRPIRVHPVGACG